MILDASDDGARTGGPTFSLRNRLTRLAFAVVWLLFARWTPPQCWAWRRLLLRAFGARMTDRSFVYGSARIWLPGNLTMGDMAVIGPNTIIYAMDRIVIDDRATVSQRAHLCCGTHDHEDPHFQLMTRPIHIGRDVWIAAESFVGPGVTVGDGAVLGARGVALRDLDEWTVYSGNPAVAVRARRMRAR